ncbi:reverse transcriptase [Caerostris extrusa]|uniref:Reverse transcriptase n=1 Tax=Caerostris extrusa TaxID=172846 RepID=A0AAV4U4L7_CAEEX|nr:reverse transcriptase [Caerostris extrusa]
MGKFLPVSFLMCRLSLSNKNYELKRGAEELEKESRTKNVPNELKAEILLNILGEKANNLIVYLSEEDLCNYDKLKIIAPKDFQPTLQDCLDGFRRAQKLLQFESNSPKEHLLFERN